MKTYVLGGNDARNAFEELFARYAPLVHAMMRRGYRTEHDAQELVQQVFLQVQPGGGATTDRRRRCVRG